VDGRWAGADTENHTNSLVIAILSKFGSIFLFSLDDFCMADGDAVFIIVEKVKGLVSNGMVDIRLCFETQSVIICKILVNLTGFKVPVPSFLCL